MITWKMLFGKGMRRRRGVNSVKATDSNNFSVLSRLKREERVERQQDQLKKITSDMDEWRRELSVLRKEVRCPSNHFISNSLES